MGLHVGVYRNGRGDCSLGGLSSKHDSLTLISASGPFDPDEFAPAIRLVRRNLFGKEYVHAEPIEPGTYAYGGCIIHSSDSRFAEAVGHHYPIKLHDRDMRKEQR